MTTKFKKKYKELMENTNGLINISSAHLDGYPFVTFIDTDKDIGLSVHANKDDFEVIYNFDNKEKFANVDDALEYAKMKGQEVYNVVGDNIDSRAKYALDNFLNHAKSILNLPDTGDGYYDNDFNLDV